MAMRKHGVPDLKWCQDIVAEAIPWEHKFEMLTSHKDYRWIFRLLVHTESHPDGIHITWQHDMDQWNDEHFEQALDTVLYRLQEHIDTKPQED